MNKMRQEIKDSIKLMTEEQVDAKLKEFSRIFKPTDNRPFIDMEGNATLLDYKKAYLDMIWAFKIYVDSGHDKNVGEELGLKEIFTDG